MMPYGHECECGESRKNETDGIRLNPKCSLQNRESAAKAERQSSTTISLEGSTQ